MLSVGIMLASYNSCGLIAMLFLFGFKHPFSRSICCFDLRKKVTIRCNRTTEDGVSDIGTMELHFALISLFLDSFSRQLIKIVPF